MTTFSKQAELDFMHNFRHDTEGDRWAKHEIETLRQQLAGWLKANSPGGWIDDLRQQVTLLRAVLTRLNKADHSTLLWIFDVKEITADALSATEPKP